MAQRSRTKPRDERRGDLLDAAESVLVEKGSSALTVDQVAARAGVAKGTFYLYFQSKEEVLAALRDRFASGMVAGQRGGLDDLPADDWVGRIELWMELSLRAYLSNVRLHDALFVHAADVGVRGPMHPDNEHLAVLVDMVRRGHAAGAFAVESPVAAAVLLYGAMHGAADYAIDNPDELTVDQLVSEARGLCRRLFAS